MAVVSNDDFYMWNTPDVSSMDDSLQNYFSIVKSVADQNNQWSAEQAMKQMEFQERMSNTSHQREMADLKAAGLNPILSAKEGATSPSGAAANADGSVVSAFGNIITKLLDIQNDNSKANLISSTKGLGSGYGSYGVSYGSNSANTVGDNREAYILLLMASTGKSYNECKKIVDTSSAIIDKYGTNIEIGVNEILNKFGLTSNSAKTQADSKGSSSGFNIVDTYNKVIDKVSGAIAETIENAQNAAKKVSNVVTNVKNAVSNAVSSAVKSISYTAPKSATSTAASTINKALNKVKSLFK